MDENQTAYGTLIAEVTTAGGALPVEGANVIVYDAEGGGGVIYSTYTGVDGKTPPLRLQTVPRAYSESPDYDGSPFRVYDIRTLLDGFYGVTDTSVPIFDGVTSIQPVLLRPLPYGTSSGELFYSEKSYEELTGAGEADDR